MRIFYHTFAFLSIFLTAQLRSAAQCTSAGARSSGTAVSDGSGNFGFINPTNCQAADNNNATAVALAFLLVGSTDMLKTTNYGFSIPATASICGIQVDIKKSGANLLGVLAFITDKNVNLIKGGAVQSTNYASGALWSSTPDVFTYGGPTDRWGTSWTVADINAANFGVGFAASITGIAGVLPTVQVDDITITVYYSLPLPVSIMKFNANTDDHAVGLRWTTAGNDEPVKFAIQRSTDGSTWNKIAEQNGVISPIDHEYAYTDARLPSTNKLYYRLKMTKPSGLEVYSPIASVSLSSAAASMHIQPNPVAGKFTLTRSGNDPVQCVDIHGRPVSLQQLSTGSGTIEFSAAALQPGMYFIQCGTQRLKFIMQ